MPVYDPNLFNPNYPFNPLSTPDARTEFDQNKTIFAGMPRDAVRAWYTQAQSQYLALIAGGKPVTVSYEGKSVTYTAADANRLKAAIDEAQMILGYGRQRRALRPIYR